MVRGKEGTPSSVDDTPVDGVLSSLPRKGIAPRHSRSHVSTDLRALTSTPTPCADSYLPRCDVLVPEVRHPLWGQDRVLFVKISKRFTSSLPENLFPRCFFAALTITRGVAPPPPTHSAGSGTPRNPLSRVALRPPWLPVSLVSHPCDSFPSRPRYWSFVATLNCNLHSHSLCLSFSRGEGLTRQSVLTTLGPDESARPFPTPSHTTHAYGCGCGTGLVRVWCRSGAGRPEPGEWTLDGGPGRLESDPACHPGADPREDYFVTKTKVWCVEG